MADRTQPDTYDVFTNPDGEVLVGSSRHALSGDHLRRRHVPEGQPAAPTTSTAVVCKRCEASYELPVGAMSFRCRQCGTLNAPHSDQCAIM